MLIALAIAAALVSSPSPQRPNLEDGNGLLRTCKSRDHVDVMRCYAFLSGVLAGAGAIVNRPTSVTDLDLCVPEAVTMGQIRDIVNGGLEELPQVRHERSGVLVLAILSATYPCGTGEL